MSFLSDSFETPYYAVIFSSVHSGNDVDGYGQTAVRMFELAAGMDGFLGVESAGSGAEGITVSYWRDEAAIAAWKMQGEHALARKEGRKTWYSDFRLRIARVERAYEMSSSPK